MADLGRPTLYLLGLLGAVKAAGLVLVAQAVAVGLAAVLASTDAWRPAIGLGLLGALLRGLSSWALQAASARVSLGVKEKLRTRVLESAVRTGRGPVGATTALATTGLDELDRYYTVFLPTLVGAAVVPALIGVRILFADWVSALIVVLTLPLIPVFMALIGLHTRDAVAAATTALGRLSDHMVELARGLPVLIGLGRVREQSRALRSLSDEWRASSLGVLRVAFLSALALELIATLSVAIVAVFVGVRLVNGTMPLEAGLLALLLAPECYAPFRDMGSAFHASQTGLEARRRVGAALEDADGPARGAGAAGAVGAMTAADAAGAIARSESVSGAVVTGLTVTHAGRAEPTVAGLGFAVQAGEVIALSGASGAGKSTVLRVLAGRGAELEDEASATGSIALPERIAFLPQHPQFARESAAGELVAYGATPAEASALLERLGLPDAAPARLSPGEQRRLAFARVLVRADAGARLALLDEPTAHLDEASASTVRHEIATLAARGLAVVIASHDPQLRALADRVVFVSAASAAPVAARPEPTIGSSALPGTTSALAAGRPDPAVVTKWASDPDSTPLTDDPPRAGLRRSSESGPFPPRIADYSTTGPAAPEQAASEPAATGQTTTEQTAAGQTGPEPTGAGGFAALRRVLAPAALRIAGAIGLGTLAALFAVALTALSGWLIVRAAEHPPILFLEVAIVGVRFFGIGRAALRYAERLVTHDAVFTALTELRMRLWAGLAAQGPAGRVQLTAANTLDRLIGDGDRVRDLAPRVVIPLCAGVLGSLGAVIALWVLWPPAGLMLLAACIVALVGGGWVAIAADARATRARDRDRSLILRRTAALLLARDDLAANGVADTELAEMAAIDAQAASTAKRSAGALGAGAALVAAVFSAAAVAMIGLGVGPTSAHLLSAPVLAVLALTPLALIEPVLEAVGAAQRWPELAQVLRRVEPVLEAASAAEDAEPGRDVTAVHDIRIDGVAFRYPHTSRDVFSGLDFAAQPGDTIVVTGPSGSGKTTLLSVLLRYLTPTSGRYLLDDADATTLAPEAVRRRIAWCPQEGHLFDSTLRGNLAIAHSRDERATDAELINALEAVGLGPLLAALPLGLDTPIGAAGSFLSGGQRQRVAVARTLLAGSDVVLLDEPTAHLDEHAATALLADVGRALRGRVQVLVTHDGRPRPDATQVRLGAGTRMSPPPVLSEVSATHTQGRVG